MSLEPLAFEKRMDLVLSSPKWIDSLLSRNHWHGNENPLFETFSIFFNICKYIELPGICWKLKEITRIM